MFGSVLLLLLNIAIVWTQVFEKTIQSKNDLWNLGSNYRMLHLNYLDVTNKDVEDIFKHFKHVTTISYPFVFFLKVCDKYGSHIENFNLLTFKPISFNVTVEIVSVVKLDNGTNAKYDEHLQKCTRTYCAFKNRSAYQMNCANQGIETLMIRDNESSCYRTVYDVTLADNNIHTITHESFTSLFVYVVQLNLKNNPIVHFNSDSFAQMKLLRFINLPFVKNIVDETAIGDLMTYNPYLSVTRCFTGDSVEFTAWNSKCQNGTVDFRYNFTNRAFPPTTATRARAVAATTKTTPTTTEQATIKTTPMTTETVGETTTIPTWLVYLLSLIFALYIISICTRKNN